MIQAKDYHEVLGVSKDADEKQIKRAYRRLALIYHPDRNSSPEAVARFREISEAYAVLTGKEKPPASPGRTGAGREAAPAWTWSDEVMGIWRRMERERHNNMYR